MPLMRAFSFDETEEGFDYWADVQNDLKKQQMNHHHEATKKIITDLGLKGSVVKKVMDISQSLYGNKFNRYSGNSFSEKNYSDLINWLKNYNLKNK